MWQRCGSLVASGSGFYGTRVSPASRTASLAVAQRSVNVRAVMAPPQPQQRSPASTGSVSCSIPLGFEFRSLGEKLLLRFVSILCNV